MSVPWPLVEKARSVLAQERGAVVKDWGGRLPVALVYPSPYFVGMSSLGVQTVYHLLNQREDVVCERVFLALDRRGKATEPISLESQRPLSDFPVIAFSVSFELDYPNVARILRDAGIPALQSERQGWPVVIAGGAAVTGNPVPLAPLLDAAFVGEVEEALEVLVPALAEAAAQPRDLGALAQVPGVWVPALRQNGAGGLRVRRVWAGDLDRWPTASVIVTKLTEFGDMHLVEVARGCVRGCRFCLAGHIYRPLRERSVEAVMAAAEPGVREGRTVGLVAPSLSDARGLGEVLRRLVDRGARASVSSLRADTVDDELVSLLVRAGNLSITIAPEAGCDRLRRLIGKDLETDDILRSAEVAERHGLAEIKLYFMVGLPTETDDDVKEAARIVLQVRSRFSRRLVVNVASFIPKANTPFQWQGMAPPEVLEARLRLFEGELRGSGVTIRSESPRWARLQAVFSRGDERVGLALAGAAGWSRSQLERALDDQGVDLARETGPRVLGEPLPWDFIESGLPPRYLEQRASVVG
ncbi:MAG: radical SAM protein [Anaerolineae bacterium]|nr:radical SAM protein [Anaerolineae bacterium]